MKERNQKKYMEYFDFIKHVTEYFSLDDSRIDSLFQLIDQYLPGEFSKKSNENFRLTLSKVKVYFEGKNAYKLRLLTGDKNHNSRKIPDYYFDWFIDVLKKETNQPQVQRLLDKQILVNPDSAYDWIDLTNHNKGLSYDEAMLLKYFVSKLNFNKKNISENGIPLEAFLYSLDKNLAISKVTQYACAIAFSKNKYYSNYHGYGIDNISTLMDHPFWLKIANGHDGNPLSMCLLLDNIANIWNTRPILNNDLHMFQNIVLRTEDFSYFDYWKTWTFGTQEEWLKNNLLVSLMAYFEISVPDICLFKRNAIDNFYLLDYDRSQVYYILNAMIRYQKFKNPEQDIKNLAYLTHWIDSDISLFLASFYELQQTLGQKNVSLFQDFLIENYLYRTATHSSISRALIEISNFHMLIGPRISEITGQQLNEMLLQGQRLNDIDCQHYFSQITKTLTFFNLALREKYCVLTIQFAADPILNALIVNPEFKQLIDHQLPQRLIPSTHIFTENRNDFFMFWKTFLSFSLKKRRDTPNPENPARQQQEIIHFFSAAIQNLVPRAPQVAQPQANALNAPQHLNVHIRSVHQTVAASAKKLANRYIFKENESIEQRANRLDTVKTDFKNHPAFNQNKILFDLFDLGIYYGIACLNYQEPVSKLPISMIIGSVICALTDTDSWPSIQALRAWRKNDDAIFSVEAYAEKLKEEAEQEASIINDTYLSFRNTVIRYLREYSPDKGEDHAFLIEKYPNNKSQIKNRAEGLLNSQDPAHVNLIEALKTEIRQYAWYPTRAEGVPDPFISDPIVKGVLMTKIDARIIESIHKPSCPGGIVNYVIYALQGVHPDVQVDVMSKETLAWRLRATAREAFYGFFATPKENLTPNMVENRKTLKQYFLNALNACIDSDDQTQVALCHFIQAQLHNLLIEPEYQLFLETHARHPDFSSREIIVQQFMENSLPYIPMLGAIQEQMLLSFRDQCLNYWKSRQKNRMLTDNEEQYLETLKQEWISGGFNINSPSHHAIFEEIRQTQRLQTLLIGSYPALWNTDALADTWLSQMLIAGLAEDAVQTDPKNSIFKRLTADSFVVSASSSMLFSKGVSREAESSTEPDGHKHKRARP
ncbi:MAG: hypothetical protein RLZ35_330 [Pseudomonadota bacterium]